MIQQTKELIELLQKEEDIKEVLKKCLYADIKAANTIEELKDVLNRIVQYGI